jgi:hypothetical protein
MMIRIQKGFNVDIDASTGAYVFINAGTLYDDNSNKVYAPNRKKFKKILSAKKYVYYDVRADTFSQLDSELSPVDLDSNNQLLVPICYMETDAYGLIHKYLPLIYDANFNIPPPICTDTTDSLAYKNIAFITEVNIPIDGVTVRVTNDRYQIFNLFIYDMGDVILGTIQHNGRDITLAEDVSPAVCEVTYGYIIK